MPYILAGCTAVSVLSTDLVTPSIPDYPQIFQTDITAAQMVVSVNLIAYALAQLVHGPVADRHGRRRLLLVALGLFALTSVACAFAPSIEALLAGRFLQGLFSSVPSVVIVLMIRELYSPREALGVMTLYGAVMGIAPALGPLIGGYMHVWFGWSAGFLLIAGLALLTALAVWRSVPESLDGPKPLAAGRALADYAALLRNADYMRCTLAVSLSFGAFFAYVTTAPVVFIDLIGLPTQHFGLTNVVIVSAFILGNMAGSRLRDRFGAVAMFLGAMVVAAAAMVLLLISMRSAGPSVFLILAPMALYALALAFVLAAGPLVALNRVGADQPQGPAAALLGSLQLTASAVAGFVSAHLFDGTAVPMAAVMTAFVVLGAALLLWQIAAEDSAEGWRQRS